MARPDLLIIYTFQGTRDVIIAPVLRQSDAVMSLKRNNDVIITSSAHWNPLV